MNCPKCSGWGWLQKMQIHGDWDQKGWHGWGPSGVMQYDTIIPYTLPEALPRTNSKKASKPCLECSGTGQIKEKACA